MRFINPTIHVMIDYAFVVFMALAPTLFGLAPIAAITAYVIAGGYALISLMTNSPSAPIHVIPFKVHGIMEFLAIGFMAASPWLLGFADHLASRNFYLVMATLAFVVFLCTQWEREPQHRGHIAT